MPWLSPANSPDGSPRSRALSRLDPAMIPARIQAPNRASPSVTYIPSLIDGASGTLPNNCQRSVVQQLHSDLSNVIRLFPALLRSAAGSEVDRLELFQHTALAFFEMAVIVSAVPLLLSLPGALSAVWVGCCCLLVAALSWHLNRNGANGQVLCAKAPSADGWTMGHDIDDERWFFASGIGTSSRALTQKTLPTLASLFSRTIVSVHAPTYGLPFDFVLALLQRSLGFLLPSTFSRALYAQIRTALLDDGAKRTVVLAHNTGAITVSHILRQLYADIPAEDLAKLEIYTFGAAANDFIMPLGSTGRGSGSYGHHQHHHHHHPDAKTTGRSSGSGESHQMHLAELVTDDPQHQQRSSSSSSSSHGGGTPHIEHFAFPTDPFACMGVLRSVQEDLEGRFCGSVFKLNCPGAAAAHHPHSRQHRKTRSSLLSVCDSSRPLMSMADYLACLFPDAQFQQQGVDNHHHHHHNGNENNTSSNKRMSQSILDKVLYVDRDLAEKREFAALAKEWASHRTSSNSKGEKRLSWTGLGATANGMKGNMAAGVMGLELARKGCKDCSGHLGSEVSWLARHVASTSHVTAAGQYERDEVGKWAVKLVEAAGYFASSGGGRPKRRK